MRYLLLVVIVALGSCSGSATKDTPIVDQMEKDRLREEGKVIAAREKTNRAERENLDKALAATILLAFAARQDGIDCQPLPPENNNTHLVFESRECMRLRRAITPSIRKTRGKTQFHRIICRRGKRIIWRERLSQ